MGCFPHGFGTTKHQRITRCFFGRSRRARVSSTAAHWTDVPWESMSPCPFIHKLWHKMGMSENGVYPPIIAI